MATVHFTLLRPYKKSQSKDPARAKTENKQLKERFKKYKQEGKSIAGFLNPNPTRVYVHLIVDREHMIKGKIDETLLPKQWDFKRGRAKTFPGSVEVNQKLDQLKDQILYTYRKLTADNPKITFKEIEEAIKLVIAGQRPVSRKKDIFRYYKEFVDAKSIVVTKGTLKEYNSVNRILEEFNNLYNYKLTFEKIDMSFYNKFLKYLTEERINIQSGEKGLRNDTVGKHISTLKLFMQWALELGYHQNTVFQNKSFNPYPFKKDKAHKQLNQKHEIVTVTKEELTHLSKVDFSSNKRMERVRDLFLFACYTGQRWADIENFRREDIKNGGWEFYAHKTNKFTRVPFVGHCSPAKSVLEKYEYQLPKITNQEFNRTIKKVFKQAGLTREVTINRYIAQNKLEIIKPLWKYACSHMGRRSAVTLLLESGLPMLMVMKLTNHSSTKTMLRYENAGQEALERALLAGNNVNEGILKIS